MLAFILKDLLEGQAESHLDLPRAADSLGDEAEAKGLIVKRLPQRGKTVEVFVLGDVVAGDIKAGRVGDVEDVKAELESETLGNLSELANGEVGALLP